MPGILCRAFCLFAGGNDLKPVAVRVLDKIDPHCGIFVADTTHLPVLFVSSVKIVRAEGKVEFALAQIVFLRMVPQPHTR